MNRGFCQPFFSFAQAAARDHKNPRGAHDVDAMVERQIDHLGEQPLLR
jgi:hypothetical protein